MAGINPWYQGQTAPAWQPPLLDDAGNTINLTNATSFALVIRNRQTGIERAGTGAWVFLHDTTGTAAYSWSAADVATIGEYELLVTVTFNDNTELKFNPVVWEVEPY